MPLNFVNLIVLSFCIVNYCISHDLLVYACPPWAEPSKSITHDFEQQTGIKIIIEVQPTIHDLKSRIDKKIDQQNPLVDVYFVGGSMLSMLHEHRVLSLNDYFSKNFFTSINQLDTFTFDQHVFGVPLYQQMVMIDYDKKVLTQIGCQGKIHNWSEIEAALEKSKQSGYYAQPFAASFRPWTWYIVALSSGSTLFDANHSPTFHQESDPAYQSFVMITDWLKKGYIGSNQSTSPHDLFWQGDALIHQAFEGSISIGNNPHRSHVSPHATYLLMPNKHFTWRLPAGLAINIDCAHKKKAAQWIRHLLQSDMQHHLYKKYGLMPANQETINQLVKLGGIDGIEIIESQKKFLRTLPYDQPWFEQFEKALTNKMEQVASNTLSPETALIQLAAETKVMQNQYR